MSSSDANLVTNSIGIVTPHAMAAIVDDHDINPHNGRLLDRVHEDYWREERTKAAAAVSLHYNSNYIKWPMIILPHLINHLLINGIPIFEGCVSIDMNTDGNYVTINCRGYLVYILSDQPYLAVIVLELPELGVMPCLSELHMFDVKIINVFSQSVVGK